MKRLLVILIMLCNAFCLNAQNTKTEIPFLDFESLVDDLPLPPKETPLDQIKERNILHIKINKENQILIEDEHFQVENIKNHVIDFLLNIDDNQNLPEKISVSEKIMEAQSSQDEEKMKIYADIQNKYGNIAISQGIVSFQSDRNISYELYIRVQDEIVSAFIELRNRFSKKHFNKESYEDLNENEQKLLRYIYPINIREPEPQDD